MEKLTTLALLQMIKITHVCVFHRRCVRIQSIQTRRNKVHRPQRKCLKAGSINEVQLKIVSGKRDFGVERKSQIKI